MAKKEKIYVLCKTKSQYSEVLKYKARLGHRWRQSQQLVLNNNETIREWIKHEDQTTLGIHEDGGMCRLEKAREKGSVITFDSFTSKYNSIGYPQVQKSHDDISADSFVQAQVVRQTEEVPTYRQKSQEKLTTINNQNSNKMTNSNSMFASLVPSRINASDVVLTMTGKIAYRRKDGEYVRYDSDQDTIVKSLDIFPNFNIGKFCFVIPTAATALAVGDIILHKGDYKEIISLEGGIKTVNLNSGANSTIKKETIEFINLALISKVVCIFGDKQASAGTFGMNPMMMMMLSKDGGSSSKMDDLLPLMMMQGGGFGGAATDGAANPMAAMLPMMMMSGDGGFGGDNDMMKMMAMSSMMGGQAGANPFGSLFGGAQAATVATPVVVASTETTADKIAAAKKKIADAAEKKELKALEKQLAALEADAAPEVK